MEIEGRALLAGVAEGEALVLSAPISFWGGVDATTGNIIDKRHPQAGASVAGRVLVMPYGKGSSSASSVLAECLRLGTGPRAIVLDLSDEILLAGALVAGELYDAACPIIVVPSIADFESGRRYRIEAGSAAELS
jgi:predicted aconitase with swiveling domain